MPDGLPVNLSKILLLTPRILFLINFGAIFRPFRWLPCRFPHPHFNPFATAITTWRHCGAFVASVVVVVAVVVYSCSCLQLIVIHLTLLLFSFRFSLFAFLRFALPTFCISFVGRSALISILNPFIDSAQPALLCSALLCCVSPPCDVVSCSTWVFNCILLGPLPTLPPSFALPLLWSLDWRWLHCVFARLAFFSTGFSFPFLKLSVRRWYEILQYN